MECQLEFAAEKNSVHEIKRAIKIHFKVAEEWQKWLLLKRNQLCHYIAARDGQIELQKKAGRREQRYRLIVDTAKCEVAEP